MVTQKTVTRRLLPLEFEETEEEPEGGSLPLYEFEPSAEAVLDALLPRTSRAASTTRCSSRPPRSSRRGAGR